MKPFLLRRPFATPPTLIDMKFTRPRIIFATLCIAAVTPASAQTPPGYPSSAVPSAPLLTSTQLQDIVGRIALYPDDLVALILPASTTPLDIVKAQRFLTKHAADKTLKPDPTLSQPVLNLLTYPDVVNMMGDDLDWTESLGQAVTAQQQDVLDAIQIFRRKAQAAGNLKSDDKQTIIVKQETVQIVPAKPEVIYVPVYQPATVVVAQSAPAVTYVPTAYPVYYNPVATAAVAATVGYIAGANTAYGVNWYGGGCYHAPYASYANHIQEERMDYANNAREDWQNYGTASREDWQKYSSNQQSQRQNAAASNQASRQQTSTANQTQRQQAVNDTTSANQTQRQGAAASGQQQRSANQTQRQDAAAGAQASSQQSQAARQSAAQQNQAARQANMPQGGQSWQGSAQTRPASGSGQAAAANRAASSSQFGTRQASRSSAGTYGGASSGARAQSYAERGSRSMSGSGRSGGGSGRSRR
jgi:flagellar biosynthesis GTPase FlhF